MSSSRLADLTTSFITMISTLIILKVQLPYGLDLKALEDSLIPFLFGVNSFLITVMLWYNHVLEIRKLKFVSFPIFALSILWAFSLLLLPFAAGWLAEDPHHAFPYTAHFVVLSVCFILFELILLRLHQEKAMDLAQIRYYTRLRLPMYLLDLVALVSVQFWPESGLIFIFFITLYNAGYLFWITRGEKSQ